MSQSHRRDSSPVLLASHATILAPSTPPSATPLPPFSPLTPGSPPPAPGSLTITANLTSSLPLVKKISFLTSNPNRAYQASFARELDSK